LKPETTEMVWNNRRVYSSNINSDLFYPKQFRTRFHDSKVFLRFYLRCFPPWLLSSKLVVYW